MGVIDFLHSVAKHLPVIKAPDKPTTTKEKIMWTGVALMLFFLMYNVICFGVIKGSGGIDFLQTITASNIGSLLTAGIGPVVLASIFLQLFVGAGLINLDLKDKSDKQKFLEVQKIVAILLAVAEGGIFVLSGRTLLIEGLLGLPLPAIQIIVTIQIALGSIVILYLDEIVTKYGLGSGVSLFIAAGVSFAIISGFFGLVFGAGGVVDTLGSGGAEALPMAILRLLPFFFMILVFLVVVYFEGVKVEIPIAFERVRGMVPKLPLKYFYVSNIPVIFAAALLMNVQLFAGAVLANADLPFIGYVDSNNRLADGLLYFVTPIFVQGGTIELWNFITTWSTPVYGIPEIVHALTYILFLSLASILFGMFWVETSNMDAKSVADQLSSSGLQIPGFRRDPRMLQMILNKHIFPLTVLGSFSVGLLAGIADMTGALGTGTGILLTVGILYRMYEQLEQMQAFDMYPGFGNLIK
jgi:preprotein translocase subunit SecY